MKHRVGATVFLNCKMGNGSVWQQHLAIFYSTVLPTGHGGENSKDFSE